MSSDDEVDFSTADAMAAHGNPIRAGEVKNGDYVLIQGHVCKVGPPCPAVVVLCRVLHL